MVGLNFVPSAWNQSLLDNPPHNQPSQHAVTCWGQAESRYADGGGDGGGRRKALWPRPIGLVVATHSGRSKAGLDSVFHLAKHEAFLPGFSQHCHPFQMWKREGSSGP
jgi:hypothetical protein